MLARLLGLGLSPGAYPIHSLRAWQAWATMRLLDEARTWLFPLYSSALTPMWLRLLGARVGRRVEASTVLLIPKLTSINDEAFLADDTLLGSYELGGGWLRVERTKIGKRAFVGNSGMTAPGRKVPKQSLVAVLSAAPRRKKAKAGSLMARQPAGPAASADRLRRRQPHLRAAAHAAHRPRPGRVLPAARGHRLAPAGRGSGPRPRAGPRRPLPLAGRSSLAGPVLMVGGALAAGLTSAVKWALVGQIPATEHPLWSSFVWRSELADTFVEVVAAPWFARAATGTFALNLWLRSLGAWVGRGVWCETYWLPEPDLVEMRDGVTVNKGCVVQTHLFHDRVLSMDRVTLRRGLDARSQQRDPPGLDPRPPRYGWPRVTGDEGRVRARQDPVDGQPHRALDRRLRRADRVSRSTDVDSYTPGHGDASYDVTHYDLELTYKVEGNLLNGVALLACVALADLDRFTLDLHGLRVRKVGVDGTVVEVHPPPGLA